MASTSYKSDSTVWDAFLNFRGPDTHKGFISHLYAALDRAGIRTFLDDRELPIGGELSPQLLKAIRESKVSIVVFSSNYASSSWCLEELVKILECRKKGQLVVPVFYNVNQLDVRHQKESFTQAFKNHEKYFAVDKLDMWRAANLKGHHHRASGDGLEANLIQEIVDKVLHKVNPMRLYVAKEPVEIESRVEKITQLLILGNNDVRMIGIYGMGGIGKTTIAKAVYNKIYVNFEGSCFLMNVREVSGDPNGLVGLQNELLYEVLKIKDIPVSTVDRGIRLIEERLRHKKVLIVLDDLDHIRQLNSLAGQWNRFAPGSRIIITTRDGRLLDQIQVDDRYQVGQMNKDEALELLSRHAFGKSIPDEDFMDLSKDVLRFAGGVPLALEVFGSNLVNQTMIEWRSFIKKLQQSSHHEIEEKLIISFDALKDYNLQDIFLDITCFFIGVDKNETISILNACDSCAEYDIAILEKRCLLTIDGNNKLRMHDLLQDMGRGIVRKKSKIEGGMLSRLWSSGDISAVMKSTKGTSSIEGIIPKDF